MKWRSCLVLAVGWVLATAPAAPAAPPSNDARAAARPLGTLPADLRGTTVESSLESDEPFAGCAAMRGSVWYAFDARESRSIAVALDAEGELDAVVDVFVRERSQITQVACRPTNRRGTLTFELDGEAGTSYLLRVASRANSVDGGFRLRVIEPERPASFPGERLPRRGANASVDRLANPDDAWSVRMRRGTAYRINLVSSGSRCARVDFYVPGGGDVVRRMRCDAHTVFVPERSGLHTLHVQAPRASRDRIPYRLRAGRAGADDVAPGLRLANDVPVRGTLRGAELDALDLYRFSLANSSRLRLTLQARADFQLVLLDDDGDRIADGVDLERRLRPGRYFVAVRARDGAGGRYTLRRLARTITRSDMQVTPSTVAPGGSVALALEVSPAVDGPTTMVVERFDPLAGWLFHAKLRPEVRGGRAAVGFRPPSVGRWRVTGSFDGTRRAAPSEGGTAHFRVEEPLAAVALASSEVAACKPVENPYAGTRYDGVDLTRIRAEGVRCSTARRVARRAHRKALAAVPDANGIVRVRWRSLAGASGPEDRGGPRRPVGRSAGRWEA